MKTVADRHKLAAHHSIIMVTDFPGVLINTDDLEPP